MIQTFYFLCHSRNESSAPLNYSTQTVNTMPLVYSLRFDAAGIYLVGRVPYFLSSPLAKRAKRYALNWFYYIIVCPFWAMLGKYYSKQRGKLMQLRKERTVIALGFYLIRGKLQLLQLLQASMNTLYIKPNFHSRISLVADQIFAHGKCSNLACCLSEPFN